MPAHLIRRGCRLLAGNRCYKEEEFGSCCLELMWVTCFGR
jgi:hypothetical protein